MQPGQTLTPGQNPDTQQPGMPNGQNMGQLPVPESSDQPNQPQSPPPESSSGDSRQTEENPEPSSGWNFSADDKSGSGADKAPPTPNVNPVNWTASEYIQHNKNFGWFVAAGIVIVLISIGVYFLTHDLISTFVIGVSGLAFSAFSARPPQVLNYLIDSSGIHIGQKTYPYKNFRSFSLQDEGPIRSILLMPAQRVTLPITIYFDPKDEAKIVQALGTSLPHEMRGTPAIDKFMRKIRF